MTHGAFMPSVKFQSTLSVRRATVDPHVDGPVIVISIHALRKESDGYENHSWLSVGPISIHALRKESDRANRHRRRRQVISIHALRKESDLRRISKRV